MPLDISTDLPDSRALVLGQLVTQESAVNAIVSVWQALSRKASVLVQAMQTQLTDLDEKAQTFPIKKADYKELLKLVKDFSFVTYSDTLVTVPEGFTGQYTDFLLNLNTIGAAIALKAPKLIDEYTRELAIFITNKDARQSLRSLDSFYKTVQHDRLEYEKALKVFVDARQPTRSRVRLGSVIERFQDLEQVFYQAERLEALRKEFHYTELLAGVTKASELLKTVKDRFEDDSDITFSKDAVKNLATGAYEMAEYVELVATYGYLVESALGAIQASVEQLNDLFKKQAG